MPPVLNLKPDEVDSEQKRRRFSVSVVGCGHKGIFLANVYADAGYSVVCTDANASVVKRAAKGRTAFTNQAAEAKLKSHIASEKIEVLSDLKKAVAQSDIILVAINTGIDEQKKNDCTALRNTCKHVGAALHAGALVVYSGVAGLGFMDGTIRELLENTSGLKAGKDFGLAYCPVTSTATLTAKMELMVSAADPDSLEAAATVLKTVNSNLRLIQDFRTAEVAALFTIAKQDVETALTNELAVFCEGTAIDYFKVIEILNLNKAGFKPTIAKERSREAYILLENAENLNIKLKLPALARQINQDIVKHTVNLTQNALRGCGKTLRRGRVAVLGSANPASATGTYVRFIEQKGAKVTVYDPAAKRSTFEEKSVKTGLSDAVEGADCIVLLSEQHLSHITLKKLKSLMNSPALVVDLMGKFEPGVVETEGFIYAGLGRGTDRK